MATKKPTKLAAKKPAYPAKKTTAKKTVKPVAVADKPEPTVGPTGLCRQCNKPADHKHAGV